MRATLPSTLSSPFLVSLLLLGCGTDKSADYRSPKLIKTLEAVAEKPNAVVINFTLPDRSVEPSLSALNGYYLRLVGEGPACPVGEIIEEVASWEDANREVHFKVNGKCTYAVTLRLGTYQPPMLALGAGLNFDEDIRPIIETNCVSCHETYASYVEVVQNGEMILKEIEAKTMPQIAPLSDADIAKFLAWKDGGYLEKSTTPLKSAKEIQLTSIYYQNNHNDFLMAYELLSRSTYELRRSLWLQPEGKAAGMVLKEISTFGAN